MASVCQQGQTPHCQLLLAHTAMMRVLMVHGSRRGGELPFLRVSSWLMVCFAFRTVSEAPKNLWERRVGNGCGEASDKCTAGLRYELKEIAMV